MEAKTRTTHPPAPVTTPRVALPPRPMRQRLRIATVVGSILLLVLSGVALASSYWSTLDFTVAVNGLFAPTIVRT